MSILLFVLSVCYNIQSPVSALSCKDESGLDIPTWTIMKLPKSTDYYYYDTNTGYNFSPNSLNDTENGALSFTMKQMWDSNTQYIIYNDSPPNQENYNFSVAHSKGVWMWNDKTAIVVTHSIPKFPQGPQEQEIYTGLMENAWEYGQAASCFKVSLSSLPNILSLIRATNPSIYEQSCNNCYNKVPYQMNLNTSIPCNTYKINGSHTLFTKQSSDNIDIWASCIAPYFSSQVSVESWIHGTTDGPYCPPDYSYPTLDIQSLQFPGGESFKEYYDHSKWGILKSPNVCFGDLNRVTTQKTRAGSVYCWKDSELWNQLNELIVSTNSC